MRRGNPGWRYLKAEERGRHACESQQEGCECEYREDKSERWKENLKRSWGTRGERERERFTSFGVASDMTQAEIRHPYFYGNPGLNSGNALKQESEYLKHPSSSLTWHDLEYLNRHRRGNIAPPVVPKSWAFLLRRCVFSLNCSPQCVSGRCSVRRL